MEITRKKKLIYNTSSSIINQLIIISCGFILPRFFLSTYGSEVNGLISSITQFLSVISLMELGVGAVVQASLYKPLAMNDIDEINKIVKSAEDFFRKIAYILIVYGTILAICYPFIIQNSFSWFFDASLVIIIGLNSFSQYYFGITNRLLLCADQRAYVPLLTQSIGMLVSTVFSVILMKLNFQVQFIKIVSVFALMIGPFLQWIYVKTHYRIDKNITFFEEPIKQKWNGVIQHLATYVQNNTDIIMLSLFSTLSNVSIYSIYNLVVNGLKLLIEAFNAGVQALFGNMLANGEKVQLREKFLHYEWVMHSIITLIFICTGFLITPFVQVYTNGINDANYYMPNFGFLLTAAVAISCLRYPYYILTVAAGHFKETQLSALVEMIINIIISFLLVRRFGLIGVAIGTLVSVAYRTMYLAYYIKNIISYNIRCFIKQIFVDCVVVLVVVIVYLKLQIKLNTIDYLSWSMMAIKIFLIAFSAEIVANSIFFRSYLIKLVKRFFK